MEDGAGAAISALRGRMQGSVILPSDADYDSARRVWNAAVDRRPALVARCAGTADVVEALRFARAHRLPLAVRGGGHSFAGHGVCDGGLVIDLAGMKGVTVDAPNRIARVEGGALGRDLGAATGAHGLVMPGGQVPTTGVGGVLLGGGIGWLTRKYGLSCDHLLSAEVVTADGTVLQASATEHPDLFWALRGGGGNFGVVTGMELRLRRAGLVLGGVRLYAVEDAPAVLRAYRDFASTAPDALATTIMFMSVPPIPLVPAGLYGRPVLAIGICYAGPIPAGQAAIAPLRGCGRPLFDLVAPLPFAMVQALGETASHPGGRYDIRSGYLSALSDAAVGIIARQVGSGGAPGLPGPLAQVLIFHLGGAMREPRVPDGAEAGAFPHRDAEFMYVILPGWAAPAEAEVQRAWMTGFAEALTPLAHPGVYVNFLGDEGPERVRGAYGASYVRLCAVKQRYDPDNVFCFNQNIPAEAMPNGR